MCFNVHYLEWVGINTEANFAFVFFLFVKCGIFVCGLFCAHLLGIIFSYTSWTSFVSRYFNNFLFLVFGWKTWSHVSHSWKYEKCESKKIWSQGNSDFDEMAYREFEDSSGQGSPLSPLLLRFLFFVCFSLFPVSRLNRCRFLQFNFPIVTCAGHTPFLFL